MVRLCAPDQVFVDLFCGADVRLDGVFILTELSSETQVLKESKQKLCSLLVPNHIIALRVLFLQHLEEQRETWTDGMSEKIETDRLKDEKRE